MDIAEIRKKAKKKKTEEKEPLKLQEIEEEKVSQQLPVVSEPEKTDAIEQSFDFVDEDLLYKKLAKKESEDAIEYLCFKLGEEEYCLEVSIANEIIKPKEITEVPKSPDFILGVFSIRGEVLPLFDIKKLLNIKEQTVSIRPRFIIINLNNDKVGICVDEITAIRKLSAKNIEQTPINIQGAKKEFIKGIAIIDGKTLRILDIEKIMSF
ncbi:MAG: chemotaxis protein CheW [Proteobacteria bacterium]|nr:chemotaxis protein CheW [Pseudomonadota bacterium]